MAHTTDELNSSAPTDQFTESLERLSKKNGVLGTIVIDRSSGAILNTAGSLSSIRSEPTADTTTPIGGNLAEDPSSSSTDESGMHDMARMVWNYMAATRELVQGLDAQDEVKLLRLRTKKYELVIVPDPRYLLVVIHATPSA